MKGSPLPDRPPVIRDGHPLGKAFPTPVGTGLRYQLDPVQMGVGHSVVGDARGMAQMAGWRVVDVVSSVQQPDGTWIVELSVEPTARQAIDAQLKAATR